MSGTGITKSISTEAAGTTGSRVGTITKSMVTNIGRIRMSMIAGCINDGFSVMTAAPQIRYPFSSLGQIVVN
jgi:hypothetical protein